MADIQVGVQLYTVRDQLEQDFAGTLNRCREIGYTHAEIAGLGSRPAVEFAKALDDAGLVPVACHFLVDLLEKNISEVIDDAKALNIEHVVCPWLPEERRADEAGWKRCAELLNKAGQACQDHGLQLSYHNHSFEFVKVGHRWAMDLLFEETDPACVGSELDTYWVKHGGEDPVAYIQKLTGRVPILHLKDMMDDADRSFGEVGEGILDWPAIFAAAEVAGTSYAIVEQDICPGDPFDSIAISARHLKQMGLA